MPADTGTEEESPPPSRLDGVMEKDSFSRTENAEVHEAPLDRAVETYVGFLVDNAPGC
jgi:hypothetical protein